MTRPFLLLTNDDGIYAPGIKHLWEAVREYADTAIVAPLTEKSGCGLSITWGKPLMINKIEWEGGTQAWSLTGTPADCVKIGLSVLLDRKPDLILSGINKGSNAGRTALYSGTVGGVIEGVMKGIPGIAFSFPDEASLPLSVTKNYIYPLIQHFLANPLPEETLLNVNFPYVCETEIKGVRLATQGKGQWIEQPDRRIHPEGLPYFWLGGRWNSCEEDPESDVALLKQGYITAVPLKVVQLTNTEVLATHKEALQKKFDLPLAEYPRS